MTHQARPSGHGRAGPRRATMSVWSIAQNRRRSPTYSLHGRSRGQVVTAPKGAALIGPKSRARVALHNNSDDVRSLWSLYQASKSSPAVQRHLGPANKGTYLLIAALWETYCEDVLLETTEELLAGTDDPESLPVAIRRAVARDLKEDRHDLSPWVLADSGWRAVVETRARRLCREVIFHSPKAGNVDDLFRRTLGIENISLGWTTERTDDPRTALNEHLSQRGELAHRAAATTISKRQVSDFYQLVMDLTKAMDRQLGEYLFDTTGKDPFAVRDFDDGDPTCADAAE